MYVTKTEAVTKTKYKVYVDGEFAFVLYKGELSRCHIAEGQELPESVYLKIKNEIVLKRAKLYAMHLLTDMDRTELQLCIKLRQALYTDDIVEGAVSYVKSFGYIDDTGYAKRYISGRQHSKSRKEIYAALIKKGVSPEIIESAMESCYEEEEELAAVRRLIQKRRYCAKTATEADRQKLYRYLAGKGFGYDKIKRAIESSI